jgi:cation transport regulator ChaB
MPRVNEDELPGTIRRSPEKAQRTYAETLESAHEEYSDEERAHRTAYASLEHNFEKVGDHWEPKDRPGPSDERSRSPRGRAGRTAGGVDVEGHTRKELYDRARDLRVPGRSKMTKMELAQAIARKQD